MHRNLELANLLSEYDTLPHVQHRESIRRSSREFLIKPELRQGYAIMYRKLKAIRGRMPKYFHSQIDGLIWLHWITSQTEGQTLLTVTLNRAQNWVSYKLGGNILYFYAIR